MERIRLFSERERAEDGKRRGRSGSGVAEGAYCGQRVKQRQEDQQANPSHLTGLPTGEHRQKNGLDYGQSEPGTEWALCASIDFAFVNRLRLTTSRDKESEQEKAKQLRVNGNKAVHEPFGIELYMAYLLPLDSSFWGFTISVSIKHLDSRNGYKMCLYLYSIIVNYS